MQTDHVDLFLVSGELRFRIWREIFEALLVMKTREIIKSVNEAKQPKID